MNEYTCDVCSVSLPKTSWDDHIQGKKHKSKLHEKHQSDMKTKNGIFVGGIPLGTKPGDVKSLFATQGKVTDFHMGDCFALLQFEDAEVAKSLIKDGTIKFNNRVLHIKPRLFRKGDKQIENDIDKENEVLEIINGIRNLSDFQAECSQFFRILEPDPKVKDKYMKICYDLEWILNKPYPGCKVYAFGSTISGLQSRTSDVDTYVDVPNKFKAGEFHVEAVKTGRMFMNKPPKKFANCIAITKARTPIIRCTHLPTKMRCDINFKSILGVYNSQLIKYYTNLDKKIWSLIITVKVWCRAHDLNLNNYKFSNYAVAIFVIFFLQQEPFGLPSVQELQKNPKFAKMHNGWNGGFEPIKYLSSALIEIDFRELLLKFFKFYNEFDYTQYFVCPYTGRPVEKLLFLEMQTVPECFVNYREASKNQLLEVEVPICIQDPFEHNHNLTRMVTAKFLEEFLSFTKLMVGILSSNKPSLYRLLTEKPRECYPVLQSDKFCEFPLLMGSYLTFLQEKSLSYHKEGHIQELWFETLCDFIQSFFKEVLKFETITSSTPEVSSKAQKLDTHQDVHDSIENTVSLHYQGFVNVWESRKSVGKSIKTQDLKKTVLERESCISDYIRDVLFKSKSSENPIIEIKCKIREIKHPVSAHIRIDKLDNIKGHFSTLSTFLTSKLNCIFAVYEKELNDEAKNRRIPGISDSISKTG